MYFYQENSDLKDCVNITSYPMGWNQQCIITSPYLFPLYNIDVTNIVCQDITHLDMDRNKLLNNNIGQHANDNTVLVYQMEKTITTLEPSENCKKLNII